MDQFEFCYHCSADFNDRCYICAHCVYSFIRQSEELIQLLTDVLVDEHSVTNDCLELIVAFVVGKVVRVDRECDLFEERVMAAADSASAAGAVSAMREAQRSILQHSIRFAVAMCVVTYLVSALMPILMALVLSAWWMGALNWALFKSVPFGATDTTNRVLLAGS